jgi:hypothetical protein
VGSIADAGLAKRTRELGWPLFFGGREAFFKGTTPLDHLVLDDDEELTASARASSASIKAAPLATIPRESVTRREALL